MKTILKPTLLKIALAIVLLALSSYLLRMYITSTISDTFPWGFPLRFYLAWEPCPPDEPCSESNFIFLLIDIVFWYMISGLLTSKFAGGKSG